MPKQFSVSGEEVLNIKANLLTLINNSTHINKFASCSHHVALRQSECIYCDKETEKLKKYLYVPQTQSFQMQIQLNLIWKNNNNNDNNNKKIRLLLIKYLGGPSHNS